uniref:NAC-A/B domain-containing protein n=1 Tax=Aegilops tauschii subsp. strangulata TaxID=200361 RepID=A0A453GKG1_AEGTS
GGDASGRSRSEKKCRKAMEKLGMKAITGVSRVTIKQSKTVSILTTSAILPCCIITCWRLSHFRNFSQHNCRLRLSSPSQTSSRARTQKPMSCSGWSRWRTWTLSC